MSQSRGKGKDSEQSTNSKEFKGDSLLIQLGGGFIAAAYNKVTNGKLVEDHKVIEDPDREELHDRMETEKRLAKSKSTVDIADKVQGQNNLQTSCGQGVAPPVVEKFQQWAISSEILHKNTLGQPTEAQKLELDAQNHKKIGDTFDEAGQDSGKILHHYVAYPVSKVEQIVHKPLTQEERDEVSFAVLSSESFCSSRRDQLKEKIKEERSESRDNEGNNNGCIIA